MVPERASTVEQPSAYRIVVPIADPDAVSGLLRIAAAIADQHFASEVVATSIVEVPVQTAVSQARERSSSLNEWQREALRRAEDAASELGLSLRTVDLWAHDGSDAVLRLIEEENATHVVLHWRESDAAPSLSARDIQTIARKTRSEVTLLRLSKRPRLSRIAALVSQSPHAARATRRAWHLAQSSEGSQLTLIHAAQPSASRVDAHSAGRQLIYQIASEIDLPPESFDHQVLIDADPLGALLNTLGEFDTVCMGASAQTEIAEALFGSVPAQVSKRYYGTVVIVQRPRFDQRTVIDAIMERLME